MLIKWIRNILLFINITTIGLCVIEPIWGGACTLHHVDISIVGSTIIGEKCPYYCRVEYLTTIIRVPSTGPMVLPPILGVPSTRPMVLPPILGMLKYCQKTKLETCQFVQLVFTDVFIIRTCLI